jgi:GntR family transcriptional regulator
MDSTLFLSVSVAKPMYQQVIDQITARIVAGDWPSGTALPSIRELASANRVSVITVKRAYQELERAGVIITRQGKGSFVAMSAAAPRAMLLAELNEHLHALLGCATKLGLTDAEITALLEQAKCDAEPTPP